MTGRVKTRVEGRVQARYYVTPAQLKELWTAYDNVEVPFVEEDPDDDYDMRRFGRVLRKIRQQPLPKK